MSAGRTPISFRLSEAALAQLQALSKAVGKSRSETVEYALFAADSRPRTLRRAWRLMLQDAQQVEADKARKHLEETDRMGPRRLGEE